MLTILLWKVFSSNLCFYTPFTDSLAPDPVSTHRSRHSLSHRQSKRMPFQVDWETWPPRMSGRRRLTKSGDRWCDPCLRVAISEQRNHFTKDFNKDNFNQFGIYDEWHIIIRLLIIFLHEASKYNRISLWSRIESCLGFRMPHLGKCVTLLHPMTVTARDQM